MNAKPKVVAIDLDGTLVKGDQALPGAKEAVNLLREKGCRIAINTCNSAEWAISVLNNNDIRYDAVYGEGSSKPAASLYVDDKGYHFLGDWSSDVQRILARLELEEDLI